MGLFFIDCTTNLYLTGHWVYDEQIRHYSYGLGDDHGKVAAQVR
jgi:hypothetical protein